MLEHEECDRPGEPSHHELTRAGTSKIATAGELVRGSPEVATYAREMRDELDERRGEGPGPIGDCAVKRRRILREGVDLHECKKRTVPKAEIVVSDQSNCA